MRLPPACAIPDETGQDCILTRSMQSCAYRVEYLHIGDPLAPLPVLPSRKKLVKREAEIATVFRPIDRRPRRLYAPADKPAQE